MPKPRIGVSACLLGEEVRYDGGHKRNATLIELVGPHVEWVAVCPEVEVGMETPREALQLMFEHGRLRMVTVRTGIDYTDAMGEWARRRVGELERDDLDGYVLKSGSPSCGLAVSVVNDNRQSKGLFAAVLTACLPALPVIDERTLQDGDARAEFLRRVVAYRKARREVRP